jgi:predicted MFS family arabinose efflux permease
VFRDPVLRTLLLITTTMGFAVAGPTDVGLAALARTRFDGAVGLGVLLGSFGAGMLVGTLAAGVVRTRRVTPRLAGAALVFAALMPLLGVAPSLPVAIALIVVMGAAAGQVNVIASAWLMRRTDPALIGRVMSLLIVSSAGVSPVSLAVAGALAQVSVPLVFTTSGALMLLAAIAALANRTMRAT